jgi:TPR repeat protein
MGNRQYDGFPAPQDAPPFAADVPPEMPCLTRFSFGRPGYCANIAKDGIGKIELENIQHTGKLSGGRSMTSLFKFGKQGKRPIWEYGVVILLLLLCLATGIFFAPKSDMNELRLRALMGSASAAYELAERYASKAPEKSLFWYRWAAWRGFREAQLEIARIYEKGLGVEQDYAKAVFWYRKAARPVDKAALKDEEMSAGRVEEVAEEIAENRAGYQEAYATQAMESLADIYEQGRPGVTRDYAESVRWLRKLAERGDSQAQYNLGQKYAKGQGVQQDYWEAFSWYARAADRDLRIAPEARCAIGKMYAKGQGFYQNYKEAFYWYEKAAKDHHTEAEYALGVMYDKGLGVKQDEEKAIKWYEKVDHAAAQYSLGLIYEKRLARDYSRCHSSKMSLKWYEKAAVMEYLDAGQKAGVMAGIMEEACAEEDHVIHDNDSLDGERIASEEDWDCGPPSGQA